MTYEVRYSNFDLVQIEASSELDARRKAMILRYGTARDNIVPYAPAYKGRGLSVVEVAQ